MTTTSPGASTSTNSIIFRLRPQHRPRSPSNMSGCRLRRSQGDAGGLDPQIPVLQLGLGQQLLGGAAPHGAAAFDHVVTVGDFGEVAYILVDDQHRLPL